MLPAPPLPSAPEIVDPHTAEPVKPSAPKGESSTEASHYVANRRAEILLRAARNSVAMGDLPQALERFDELLRLEPDNEQVRYEYGGLLLQAGRLADGRRQLEHLVSGDGDVGEYRLALGNLLMRLKDYQPAREQFRALLSDPRLRRQATIKLAQSLVLEHRHAEARKFYDEHIARLRDLDPATTVALAQLLIDMRRPEEAVRLLEPLHEAHREDETIAAPLVLALVNVNERGRALALIDALPAQELASAGPWIALADRLYDEQALAEALALYQEILRRWPHERHARLWMARTYLRLYEVDRAKAILDELGDGRRGREYSTVLIDYHTLVGEYAEAIELAKRRRRANRRDVEATMLLADAYHASQQYAHADAIYAAALTQCPTNDTELRRTILRLHAKNYLLSRQYPQAVNVLDGLLREQPADVGSRILLVEALTKMRCFGAAKQVATTKVDGQTPREQSALQTRLGYVLLEQGNGPAAAAHFDFLVEAADEPPPEMAYGLYRAAQVTGQGELARYAFGLGPTRLAPGAYWATVFANLAMNYCDCPSAAVVVDGALQGTPGNLVLLNLRGEAAQLCDCRCDSSSLCDLHAECCGEEAAGCANGWFIAALRVSPTNVRARLGLARSLERHMAYGAAEVQYSMVVRQMPGDPNVKREMARMVESNHGLEAAHGLYASRPPAASLDADLEDDADFFDEDLDEAAPFSDDVDPTDVPNSANTGEPEPMLFDQFMSMEFDATAVRGWHLYEAIPRLERLIEVEPWNDAALFNLAQAQSALGRTQCAIETYRRLLAMNPCHEDAATALLRTEMELHPKILPVIDYQKQFGREGLANITWLNLSFAARHPLGDADEFFEWGYRERLLQPTDDRANWGQIPFVRWQQKYATDSLMFIELAVENYQYGLQTRPTFRAGLDLLNGDDFNVMVTGYLENYYVCGEAIRQDIYTTGIQIDAVYRPTRLWTLGGFYRVANLSDHNWVNWLNVNSEWVLKEGRKQVSALVNVDFYGFAEQTIFGPNFPSSLVGTIHPYFAPSAYVFPTMGLEWKHWLSRDRFDGANQHDYSVFAGGVVDSNGIPFFVANGRWQRDVSESFTWTLDFNVIRSPNQVYNAAGAMAYGVWRL